MKALTNLFKKKQIGGREEKIEGEPVVQVPFSPPPSLYDAMHARHHHQEVSFLPHADPYSCGTALTRTDHKLTLETAKCISIDEALKRDECGQCIVAAEKFGFQSVDWEYAKSYRDCDRVVVKDANLANVLWTRLRSCLTPDDFRGMRPFGFGNDGNWIPIGINECIRYTRYKRGHKFKTHRDGGFLVTNDVRSVFTVMVYLNDEFTGGDTNFFVKESSDFEKQFTFLPKIGSMLVFNHDLWHEGCEVINGQKYILRTDIMFERIEISISHKNYLLDPDYIEAARLYNQSIKLQGEGDQEGSTECYVKALNLQAKHPTIDFVPKLDQSSEYQVLKLALLYMQVSSIMKIGTACRAWNYMVYDPFVWQKLYAARWNEKFAMRLDYNITRNWFVTFKSRFIAEKNFKPDKNEILFFDLGAKNTKFGMSKPNKEDDPNLNFMNLDSKTFDYSQHHVSIYGTLQRRYYNGPYQIESVLQQILGHYWLVDSAIDSFHVGPEVTGEKSGADMAGRREDQKLHPITFSGTQIGNESAYYRHYNRDATKIYPPKIEAGDPKMAYTSEGKPKLELDTRLAAAIFRWCIVTGLLNEESTTPREQWKKPEHFPIIIAEPQGLGSYATFVIKYICHKLLRSPYVCVVHPAELALIGQGLRSGLVVSSGHFTTQIVPVWEGLVLVDKIRIFPVAGFEFETNKAAAEERCWKKDESIVDLVCQVISSCEKEHQNTMWQKVVLSGGGTYNFSEQLEKELKQREPRCKVITPEDRVKDVVLGANILCHLSNVMERFETREEFDEQCTDATIYVVEKQKKK